MTKSNLYIKFFLIFLSMMTFSGAQKGIIVNGGGGGGGGREGESSFKSTLRFINLG